MIFFFILGLNSQNYISKSDEVDKLNLSDRDCEKLTYIKFVYFIFRSNLIFWILLKLFRYFEFLT